MGCGSSERETKEGKKINNTDRAKFVVDSIPVGVRVRSRHGFRGILCIFVIRYDRCCVF